MNPLDPISFEKALQKLPRFARSEKADAKFFERLAALVQKEPQESFESPTWRSWFSLRRMAYASSFALVFLLAAGTFAAYQPSVTRGKFLYPWKQAAERIELAAAFTPAGEVNTHLRFADRRMEEAENIIAQNPTLAWILPAVRAHEGEVTLGTQAAVYLFETLQERTQEIEKASAVVEAKIAEPEAAEKALEKIEAVSARHVEKLEVFEKSGGAEVKKIVQEAAEDEKENREAVREAVKAVKEARKNKIKEFKVEIKELKSGIQLKNRDTREERKESLKMLKNRVKEIKKDIKEEKKESKREEKVKKKAKNNKKESEDEIPLLDPEDIEEGLKDLEKLMKEVERDIIELHETVPLPGEGNSGNGRKKDRPDGRGDDLDIRGTGKIRSPERIPAFDDKKGAF